MPELSRFYGIIIRMFSERERAALGGLPADARHAAVMAWWTAKEAYVKARGVGLSLDPAGLEVVHADAAPVGVRRIDEGDPRDEPWSFRALDPWPGYVAALVAAGRGLSLSFRECRHGGVP